MRLASSLAALAVVLVAGPAAAVSSTGSRVLIALDKGLNRDDYSHFWASLTQRGYELAFRTAKESSPALVEYDEPAFDHLILFTPTTKSYPADLSPQSLVRYLAKGGNILFGVSSQISEFNRDFAREFSLEFQPSDSYLIDHTSYTPSFDSSSSSSTPHTAIALAPADTLVPNAAVLSSSTIAAADPILYRGIAHSIVGSAPLVVPILHGPRSGYSAEPRASEGPDDSPYPADFLAGSKAALASAFQTLDNSRIAFVGSIDMFGDSFWDRSFKGANGKEHATSGNKAFINDLTAWTFQEKGVIRVASATHYRDGETEPRSVYRIKDHVTYSIALETHTTRPGNQSAWTPITLHDLQLDFTMLDPHVRLDLHAVESSSPVAGQVHSADFRIPDRHGVFKFLVDYRRTGWSFVHSSQTVSVVPFRHDEYPRFIVGAYPFYSGAASTIVAFLVFSALWVGWSGDDEKVKGKKAE